MTDSLKIEKQVVLDLLPTTGPALSTNSDMPVIETKPDATPEPVVQEGAKPEETPPAPTEDSSAVPEEKKPKGVQKRIDELTRQREDERRAREAAEARELRILSALERMQGAKEPQSTEDTEPVKPLKSGFENPEDYDNAIEQYIVDKASFVARKEAQKEREQERQRIAQEASTLQAKRVQDAYNDRVQKAREKYADFGEVAESPDVQVSMPMSYAILHSEQGPDIQYYLGKNPAEAERIRNLTTTDPQGNVIPDATRQLVELGMIAAKINQPPPQPKSVSAAPPPIKPVGKGETATKSPDEMSMEEYAAMRTPQLNAERRGLRH